MSNLNFIWSLLFCVTFFSLNSYSQKTCCDSICANPDKLAIVDIKLVFDAVGRMSQYTDKDGEFINKIIMLLTVDCDGNVIAVDFIMDKLTEASKQQISTYLKLLHNEIIPAQCNGKAVCSQLRVPLILEYGND